MGHAGVVGRGGEILVQHLGHRDKVCHRSQFKVLLKQNGFNETVGIWSRGGVNLEGEEEGGRWTFVIDTNMCGVDQSFINCFGNIFTYKYF